MLERGFRFFAGAHAGAQGQRLHATQIKGAPTVQHQFRLRGVDTRSIGRKRDDVHLARAQMERAARRQQRRSDHACRTAHDCRTAVGTFVAVMPPARHVREPA